MAGRGNSVPNPQALRRQRDGKEWVKLPAAGREGATPPWPIPMDPGMAAQLDYLRDEGELLRRQAEDEVSDVRRRRSLEKRAGEAERAYLMTRAREDARAELELAMWERVWRTPQAVVWEADGQQDQVALYVRTYLEASRPEAAAALRTLVRQQAEALLLTTPAMHAARYVIDAQLAAGGTLGDEDSSALEPTGPADEQTPEQRRSRFRKVDGGDAAAS